MYLNYGILICLLIILSNTLMASTKCIAHRGNNKFFFENSVEALESAIDIGSHGVEFDVVHTRDKKALVFHDKTLERLTINKPGKLCPTEVEIKTLNYQEIKDSCLLKNHEEIPTLEKFLKILEFKKIYRFVEFKDSPTKETLELIKKYNIEHVNLLRIISFKKSYLKKAYSLRKKNTFWKKVNLLAVYKYTMFPKKKYGVNLHHSALSYINMFKRKNRELGVWTADTPKLIKKAHKLKLDFITTNDPETCLSILEETS